MINDWKGLWPNLPKDSLFVLAINKTKDMLAKIFGVK